MGWTLDTGPRPVGALSTTPRSHVSLEREEREERDLGQQADIGQPSGDIEVTGITTTVSTALTPSLSASHSQTSDFQIFEAKLNGASNLCEIQSRKQLVTTNKKSLKYQNIFHMDLFEITRNYLLLQNRLKIQSEARYAVHSGPSASLSILQQQLLVTLDDLEKQYVEKAWEKYSEMGDVSLMTDLYFFKGSSTGRIYCALSQPSVTVQPQAVCQQLMNELSTTMAWTEAPDLDTYNITNQIVYLYLTPDGFQFTPTQHVVSRPEGGVGYLVTDLIRDSFVGLLTQLRTLDGTFNLKLLQKLEESYLACGIDLSPTELSKFYTTQEIMACQSSHATQDTTHSSRTHTVNTQRQQRDLSFIKLPSLDLASQNSDTNEISRNFRILQSNIEKLSEHVLTIKTKGIIENRDLKALSQSLSQDEFLSWGGSIRARMFYTITAWSRQQRDLETLIMRDLKLYRQRLTDFSEEISRAISHNCADYVCYSQMPMLQESPAGVSLLLETKLMENKEIKILSCKMNSEGKISIYHLEEVLPFDRSHIRVGNDLNLISFKCLRQGKDCPAQFWKFPNPATLIDGEIYSRLNIDGELKVQCIKPQVLVQTSNTAKSDVICRREEKTISPPFLTERGLSVDSHRDLIHVLTKPLQNYNLSQLLTGAQHLNGIEIQTLNALHHVLHRTWSKLVEPSFNTSHASGIAGAFLASTIIGALGCLCQCFEDTTEDSEEDTEKGETSENVTNVSRPARRRRTKCKRSKCRMCCVKKSGCFNFKGLKTLQKCFICCGRKDNLQNIPRDQVNVDQIRFGPNSDNVWAVSLPPPAKGSGLSEVTPTAPALSTGGLSSYGLRRTPSRESSRRILANTLRVAKRPLHMANQYNIQPTAQVSPQQTEHTVNQHAFVPLRVSVPLPTPEGRGTQS